MIKYGSICSGIEAFSVACTGLDFEPLFFSECDPFAPAVLAARQNATVPLRYPDPDAAPDEKTKKLYRYWRRNSKLVPTGGKIKNLGDFTQIQETDYDGRIDLLVGGTPCQSFSISGHRAGISDARGNLCLEFVKLAFRTQPRILIWENVNGVLSSGEGKDFQSFLSALAGWDIPIPKGGWKNSGIVTNKKGYFGLAWRVLDAHLTRVDGYEFGIPQVRRRLFVVASLDGWESAARILFDAAACGKYPEPLPNEKLPYSSPFAHRLPFQGNSEPQFVDFLYVADAGHVKRLSKGIKRLFSTTFLRVRNDSKTIFYNGVARSIYPEEMELLFGFPVGYTNISYDGKQASRWKRYSALGNSMCCNVMRWIALRIKAEIDRTGSDGVR